MGLFNIFKKKKKIEENNNNNNLTQQELDTIERKKKINRRICLVLQGNFGVSFDDDYDTNLKRIEDYLLKDYHNLAYVLSLDTFDFLMDLAKNTHSSNANKLRKRCEDFQILANIGIFQYGSLTLKSSYKMFLLQNAQALRKEIFKNDLIMGMIDYYGYIEVDELNKLLENKYDVVNELNHILLAKLNVVVTKEAVYRKEIIPFGLKEFKELRQEFKDSVKVYNKVKDSEYIFFAHRFLKEDVDFEDPNIISYFDKKLFVLDTDTSTHLKEFGVKDELLEQIEVIDANTPKWILKGYTKVDLAMLKAGLDDKKDLPEA